MLTMKMKHPSVHPCEIACLPRWHWWRRLSEVSTPSDSGFNIERASHETRYQARTNTGLSHKADRGPRGLYQLVDLGPAHFPT